LWKKKAENIFANSDVFYNPDRDSYRKGFLLKEDGTLEFENTLDVSSLYGVMMYGLYKDKDKLLKTLAAIEGALLDTTPSLGAPRFEGDGYFLTNHSYTGNPWIVTTLWLAQFYVRLGQIDKATRYIDWSMSHTLASGMLPEQVNPDTGYATSVTPLAWSHAEFINTVLDVTKLKEQ
jgi:GH15 family glucan-1,4-alpha-glucosidase